MQISSTGVRRTLPEITTMLGPKAAPSQLDTFQPETGQQSSSFPMPCIGGHHASPSLMGVHASPYQNQLAATAGPSYDKQSYVIVWPDSAEVVQTEVPAPKYSYDAVPATFSRDGTRVAFQTATRLWVVDGHTGKTLLQKEMHLRDRVVFSPDGKNVLAPGRDTTEDLHCNAYLAQYKEPTLELIEVESGRTVAKQVSDLAQLTYTPEGDLLGTSNTELVKMRANPGGIVNWVRNGSQKFIEEWRSGKLDEHSLKTPPVVSPDGSRIAIGASSGLAVISAETGGVTAQARVMPWVDGELHWSPDGTMLACDTYRDGAHGSRVTVFDSQSMKPIANLDHKMDLADVEFTPANKLVVVTEEYGDRTLLTLNPRSGEATEQHVEGTDHIALNPRGEALVLRRPRDPELAQVAGSEWVSLYQTAVDQARKADGLFGDADERANHFSGKMETNGRRVTLSATNLDAEFPAVSYQEELFARNTRSLTTTLQSDGTALEAENKSSSATRKYRVDLATGCVVHEKYREAARDY